jgi:amidohydrolase
VSQRNKEKFMSKKPQILWCLFVLFLVNEARSQAVGALIKKQYSQLEQFYQDLHQYPELSHQEKRTAGKVQDYLVDLGLEVHGNIGGYGLAAIMKNGPGPVTMVRADMDALPVPESTGLKYKSKNLGVMHACGHDFHLAAMVGAAQVMAAKKQQWSGTLIFVAQPAEEVGEGARKMVQAGLFKKIPRPERILSLHVGGGYPKGHIGMVSGPAFANVDSVDVVFRGRGTHGSAPEKGVDPFVMAAEFILKTQTLLGREKPAHQPAVISVGAIHGGAKHNIIPDEVKILLTVRSYTPDIRRMVLKRLKEVAEGIAQTAAAPSPRVTFSEGTESTVNDPQLGEELQGVFVKAFGQDKVVSGLPTMGGEDFGHFGSSQGIPSFMFWVGAKDEKNPNVINHSPHFHPDFPRTGPIAIEAFAQALLHFHGKAKGESARNEG